jgi:hypothetical protein
VLDGIFHEFVMYKNTMESIGIKLLKAVKLAASTNTRT